MARSNANVAIKSRMKEGVENPLPPLDVQWEMWPWMKAKSFALPLPSSVTPSPSSLGPRMANLLIGGYTMIESHKNQGEALW